MNVDTPFYSGVLECCVIDRPVADLIIGNLPGVVDDVLKSSCTAVQSFLLAEKQRADMMSQRGEVSSDRECVTAHELSLAGPEDAVSPPHSPCGEPTPTHDALVTGDLSAVLICHDDKVPSKIEIGAADSQPPDSLVGVVVADSKGCVDPGRLPTFFCYRRCSVEVVYWSGSGRSCNNEVTSSEGEG